MKGRKISFFFISFIILICFAYCAVAKVRGECLFFHPCAEPTCDTEISCWLCGEKLEKPEHRYKVENTTCVKHTECWDCGEIISHIENHAWVDASCTSPKTCRNCKKQVGTELGHNYENGTCLRCKNKTYGIWTKKYYIDRFGDSTNSPYITASFSGTFSNSATTNSKLTGYWIIDGDDFCLVLEEYGRSRVKCSYGTDKYDILAKNKSGKTVELSAKISAGEDRIKFDQYRAVHELLSLGGKVDFYIEEKGNTNTNYRFTIPDCSGFTNLWGTLWKWADE